MKPISFKEQNAVFGPPEDMNENQCGDLPTFVGRDQEGFPVIISCWQPTKEELDEINKTGQVWLSVTGTGTPPILVMGTNPFVEKLE